MSPNTGTVRHDGTRGTRLAPSHYVALVVVRVDGPDRKDPADRSLQGRSTDVEADVAPSSYEHFEKESAWEWPKTELS
jgi:hypothetical protein